MDENLVTVKENVHESVLGGHRKTEDEERRPFSAKISYRKKEKMLESRDNKHERTKQMGKF